MRGVHGSANGASLDVTTDALARWGDRARGVGVVDADVTEERIAGMDRAGYRAVRLTTFLRGGLTFDHLESIAGRIAPFGWHVQVFTSTRANSRRSRRASPGCRSTWWSITWDMPAPATGSTIPVSVRCRTWSGRALLGQALRRIPLFRGGGAVGGLHALRPSADRPSPDRMLWATDWPHVMVWDCPMLQTGRHARLGARMGRRRGDAQDNPGGQPDGAVLEALRRA